MHKDTVTAPMEPFTSDEETALYERLDRLSVAELASYIGSAKSSLGNRALNPTWRPRVELALKHAELAQVREEAAAARARRRAAGGSRRGCRQAEEDGEGQGRQGGRNRPRLPDEAEEE